MDSYPSSPAHSPHPALYPFAEDLKRMALKHHSRPALPDKNPKTLSYIPLAELKKYWDKNKIQEVLALLDGFSASHLMIHRRFLRVFSLLVRTWAIAYLPLFTKHDLSDELFPLAHMPKQFEDHPDLVALYLDKINKYQWIFFPLIFDSDRLAEPWVSSNRILPIQREELIAPTRRPPTEAAVYRTWINPQCCSPTWTSTTNEVRPCDV